MNVYDFDNTIYDGESCFDLFLFYIKKRPRLIRFLPSVVRAFARYKRGEVTIEGALEEYGPRIESFFASIENPQADACEFWDGKMHKIKPLYKEMQQPDDLIITASPSFTIKEICSRLGIAGFIASEIEQGTGKITRLCMRKNKIKAFLEEYPDTQIDCFYTDSPENDAPLVEIAREAYAVKGNKITRIK